jgi:hypothetical protein
MTPDNSKPARIGDTKCSRERERDGDRMGKNRKDDFLTLKNGAKVNARHALAERSRLERLLRNHPDHFGALMRLSKAQAAGSNQFDQTTIQESVRFLKNNGDLLKDGQVRSIVRDVLISSYQETPDGPVMTQPFLLASKEDKRIADRIEEDADQRFQEWLREARSDKDDRGRSSR